MIEIQNKKKSFQEEEKSIEKIQPKTYKPHDNPLDGDDEYDLEPKFLADTNGQHLLYPGEIHLFFGRPQTFKSWVLMPLIGTCNVRYVDFENGRRTFRNRLLALGTPKDKTGVFAFPETPEELLERIIEYCETKPDVVCFDGLPGLLRMLSKDGDSNNDVNHVFSKYLVPLKAAGVAVVLLDHLPKSSTEMSDDYPIGAQAKKAFSGVLYLHRPRKGEDTVDLFVAKDRHGVVASRCIAETGWPKKYGFIQLDRGEDGLNPSVEPDKTPYLGKIEFEPAEARRMIKIWNACTAPDGLSQSELESQVKGNHQLRKEAITKLETLGFLNINKKRNALIHEAVGNLQFEWRI